MKITVKQWHSVASWHWNCEDVCGICRDSFDGCCPECKYPGDDCPPVWGQCGHAFHMHCILKWLNTSEVDPKCPLCRAPWEIVSHDSVTQDRKAMATTTN